MERATLVTHRELRNGKPRRLTPADEARLAGEHRDSRRRFAALVLALPRVWRERVLEHDPDGPAQGERWPLSQLERAYRRLLVVASGCDGAVLAARIAEAGRIKRSIDRTRDALVVSNLGLVPHVARSYANRGIAFPDLVQEGNLGLIKAVERFECDRGYRFSTYAVWWIRQALSRAILEKSRLVRLSRKTWDSVLGVKRSAVELTRSLGRDPSRAEIAGHAELTEQAVGRLLALGREPGSFEELGVEVEREAGGRGAGPLERLLRRERRGRVIDSLSGLGRKEQRLLRLRFGIAPDAPHTLEQIGRIFGVSRERIRQLEQAALHKLREKLTARQEERLRARCVDEGGKTSERGSSPQSRRMKVSGIATFRADLSRQYRGKTRQRVARARCVAERRAAEPIPGS